MLSFIQGMQPGYAQLPMLEPPWLGYFAVANESKYRLFIPSTGEFGIHVINKAGDPIEVYGITLQFLATETLPDGSVRDLPMKLDSLETSDPPNAKFKKTVFRGKLTELATGQPTWEITLEVVSGTILANARIIDKGIFDKNSLRPVIRAGFPVFYVNENSVKAEWDKKQIKEFEKRIGKDSVTLKRLDGKVVKLACVDKTDPKFKEVNGTGISSAEVEISDYQNRKIEFLAAPNSSLTLGYTAPLPLHNGFYLQWSADPAKDPEGKAKLAIRIK